MYVLLESSNEPISEADIYSIDCMGIVANEAEALEWRNANFEYRAYKYVPDNRIKRLQLKTPKSRTEINTIMKSIIDKAIIAQIEHYEILAADGAVYVKDKHDKTLPIYMMTFDTLEYLFLYGNAVDVNLASENDKKLVEPCFLSNIRTKRRF